ncbi:MAG: hypothetical protein AAF639_04110 [Chloroflexota bacterium]
MERVLEPRVDSSVLVMPLEKMREKPPAKASPKRTPSRPIKNYAKKQTPEERLRQSIAWERPAWIPDHITADWDTDPYAYQTEEELMSASFVHNDSLGDMRSEMKGIAKERGWTLYMDNFLLYRNQENIRDRVAPDLLVVPYRDRKKLTSSYDMETQPLPMCAIEIVSPSSETKDEQIHQLYVEYLKIPLCVVIWLIDDDGDYLDNPSIRVWYRDQKTGHATSAIPDEEGKYYLPELQLWIGLNAKSVYFVDEVTGETLAGVGTERLMRQAAEQQAKQEALHAEAERQQREAAQKKAEQETLRAEAERQERKTAEDESERLRALLQQHGIEY